MRRLVRVKEVLWIFAMFGLVAMVARLIHGLGAATALGDALPWGLWKVGNMVGGVCLGTSGFAIAAAVYVFKMEKLHKLVRPAILLAFLGYGASCFSLAIDIGIPWRIWHPMIYWNIHSFLFEVAMCVMFYFSICTFEMAPIVLEGKFHKLAHRLHEISFPIVLLGITLSTMHHTTLGSMFLMTPVRMHEIWFSPWIFFIFITSSVGAGLYTLVFISLIYGYLYNRKVEMDPLYTVAKGGAFLTLVYAAIKIADLSSRNVWPTVFNGQWEGILFIIENIILVVIPVGIVLVGPLRRNKNWLGAASLFSMIGIMMNRLDAGIMAFFRDAGTTYIPSLPELFITIGTYSAAMLVMFYVIENFEIFEKAPVKPLDDGGITTKLSYDPASGVWQAALRNPAYRYSGIAIIAGVIAIGLFSNSVLEGTPLLSERVAPVTSKDPKRAVLIINGNQDAISVDFKHDMHKEKLGNDESCVKCHHIDKPNDMDTACWKCHTNMEQKTSIFDHTVHITKMGENESCIECHPKDQPRRKETSKTCFECHEKDMRMTKPENGHSNYDYLAVSYVNALHKKCIECHIEKQKEVERDPTLPPLDECYNCHKDGKLRTAPGNIEKYTDKRKKVLPVDGEQLPEGAVTSDATEPENATETQDVKSVD